MKKTRVKNKREALLRLLAALLALLTWQIASLLIGESLLLPSPLAVLDRFFTLMLEKDFLLSVLFSLSRILLGFFCAVALGTLLAVLSSRFRVLQILLFPYMTAVKTVPVAALIVVAFVWFSSNTLSAFICFLIVLPTVYTTMLASLRSVDEGMLEVARVFRLSPIARMRAIYLPHVREHFISACTLGMGLAFKSGIAAEIIAVPASVSVGEKIYYAKLYLATPELYAWTLLVVLLSVLFEKGLHALLSLGFRASVRVASKSAVGTEMPHRMYAGTSVILNNVNKRYESNVVLENFSTNIPPARVTALMGASGIGKTTLLRLIARLEMPDTGEVRANEQVSVVFQDDRLSEELSAVGNVRLGRRDATASEAAGLLSSLGLSEHMDKPVSTLSGGMRRRVAIARALISDAPLLLLDEAFTGLDDGTKEEVILTVKQHIEGRTVLLVTHDEEEARLLGARVLPL